MSKSVLVIGAGLIGSEYVKLLHQRGGADIHVLTRTEASAVRVKAQPGVRETHWGGNQRLAEIADGFDRFIIAVPVDDLMPVLRVVAAKRPGAEILVEKPVSLDSAGLRSFIADHPDAKVLAALNRQFFPSVETLRRILRDDPALSGRFCFTEWVHRIPLDMFSQATLRRWGVANSIHLISTFFELLGHPESLFPVVGGALPWHPSGARFYGAGTAADAVPFAYDADWESGGRYSIEIFTARGSYSMKPLHELRFTPRGEVEDVVVEPIYAGATKCGFEGLVGAFMGTDDEMRRRLALPNLLRHIETVESIFGYGT